MLIELNKKVFFIVYRLAKFVDWKIKREMLWNVSVIASSGKKMVNVLVFW